MVQNARAAGARKRRARAGLAVHYPGLWTSPWPGT